MTMSKLALPHFGQSRSSRRKVRSALSLQALLRAALGRWAKLLP